MRIESVCHQGGSDPGVPEPPVDADRLARDAVPTMVFIVLALWISARFWADPEWVTPAHPEGQWAVEGLLTHVARAVAGGHDPMAGLPPLVPGGGALVPQAPALGVALLLAPVTLGFGAGVGYALWLTLAFAGTGAAAYWALSRYLVRSRIAATIGAFVFAYGPALLWHAGGQPEFVINALVPLILVRAGTLRPDRWVRDGVLLGVLLVGQFLVNSEVLALTAFGGVTAGLCHRVPWSAVRPRLPGLAVAAGTAAVLLAYPLWYRFAIDPLPHRVPVPDARYGEDLATLGLFWRDTLAGNATAGGIEQDTWYGWPLLILAGVCVAAVWGRSVAARVATVTALPYGLLALGAQVRLDGAPTGVPGPWWLLAKIPGLGLIAPEHFALVLLPCLAVLLAVGYDLVPSGEPAVRRLWIVLFAVALIPNLPCPLPAYPPDRVEVAAPGSAAR